MAIESGMYQSSGDSRISTPKRTRREGMDGRTAISIPKMPFSMKSQKQKKRLIFMDHQKKESLRLPR